MLVIGLTGGIASGKSTVSKILRGLCAVIIDADQVAREIVEPGQPALTEIATCFGPNVVLSDGSLDRAALARLVFGNPEMVKLLNKITHPRVIERCQDLIAHYRQQEVAVVILDVPLLIEANMISLVDEVWVVACDTETQVQRLGERDKLSREEAIKRINSQMPLEEKLKYATRVIKTDVSLVETEAQIDALWAQLQVDVSR